MCGIFGIVTESERALGELLVDAGRRLAYRGYDSVGCATVDMSGRIDLRKDVGRIDEVAARLDMASMRGLRGIVQLRWATFGAPSHENAQPHLDCDGDIVGAHNGNVVNNVQLRHALCDAGHTVRGTNDGESCVHAVETYVNRGDDFVTAIRKAYDDLRGDYALLITDRAANAMFAVKKRSGLVAGLGDGFTCASSDLPSIVPLTRRILRVDDGEILVLRPDAAELWSVATGERIAREPETYEGSMDAAEKGGFPHFMRKEIEEQPDVARDLLDLLRDSAHVHRVIDVMRSSEQLFFVGCGTSFHACQLGAYYFGRIARRLAVPLLPGQFSQMAAPTLGPRAAAVFVSQSGETKDVLDAVLVARDRSVRVLGMFNVIGSTLMNVSEAYLPIACGYEISVPATKTFVNEGLLFYYLACRLADWDVAPLDGIPGLLRRTLDETEDAARDVASYLSSWNSLYYLGYGLTEPIAREGALKLKEITYAHCEGMFSSEFKHGPLSSVQQGYPVVFVTGPSDVAIMTSAVHEVLTRGGHAIAIAEPDAAFRENLDRYLAVPVSDPLTFPLLATVPAQLIAYHMSVLRGYDPDFPRNLSKTLTVD